MGNSALAYPDRTLAASALSGGSWSTTLPLVNLKDSRIKKVARSTNALAASTQWVADLGAAQAVDVLALLGHNISLAGTIRARGYSDAGLTTLVHDTGTLYAWPQTFTAEDRAAYPNHWILPLSVTKTARYWKWEIVDTANSSGYVEAGRCWMGPAWSPTTGFDYGFETGYEGRSAAADSLDGTTWYDKKTPKRSITVTFSWLSDTERRKALVMQKTLSNSEELLFIEDKTDSAEDLLLFAFPATVRQVNRIKAAAYNKNELPLELIENL